MPLWTAALLLIISLALAAKLPAAQNRWVVKIVLCLLAAAALLYIAAALLLAGGVD
jgi:hypothetical protein